MAEQWAITITVLIVLTASALCALWTRWLLDHVRVPQPISARRRRVALVSAAGGILLAGAVGIIIGVTRGR